jgi:acyl-coenzyme A thioesterase 13
MASRGDVTIVPDSFVAYTRSSSYLDLIGPIYEHCSDASIVGLVIDDRHTNSRGMLHGGLLVAIADTVMGHTTERLATGTRLITVSLTTDFVGAAHLGDWVQGQATVQHSGRRLAFTSCRFHVDDRLILTASGVFATAGPPTT